MAFWGEVLKPGQKKALSSKLTGGDVLHLSQACVHDPKPGKNYLQVDVKGTTYSIACLEKDKREHDCLDLFFDDASTTFVCKGNSEIHIMGYIEPRSDEGLDESEEEEQPPARNSPKAAPASSPKQAAISPKTSPKAQAQPEDDEDDYDEEEEEEEEDAAPPAKSASPKTSPKAAPAQADPDDDDLSDMGMEEGEEEEESLQGSLMEDEESEEEPPAAPQKRKGAPEPAASPAKKGKTDDAGDEKSAYVKKLVEYLKKNGKTSVGNLGSKVPRPAGCPKMKQIFEQNKDKFTVVGDVVTAK